MKKKALFAFLLAVLSGGFAYADTEQTVYVNGSPISGFVTELTFSGDDVLMQLDGAAPMTEDMSLVSIDLAYSNDDTPAGITEVGVESTDVVKRVYTISGQYVGTSTEGLPAGLYIVNGKKQVIK